MLRGLFGYCRCTVNSIAVFSVCTQPRANNIGLKPFDILSGLVDKPINSIEGSCHRQSLFAAVVIAKVVSATQGCVTLIYGISGSPGANIFHLHFKGVLS